MAPPITTPGYVVAAPLEEVVACGGQGWSAMSLLPAVNGGRGQRRLRVMILWVRVPRFPCSVRLEREKVSTHRRWWA
jgi:hypothetical protein